MPKRKHTEQEKSFLRGTVITLFLIGLFIGPFIGYLAGISMIAFLLVSLKEHKTKQVLLILSPLITYPSLLAISIFSNLIFIFIIIYAFIYGLLLKNIWASIIPKARRAVAIGLLSISIITSVHFGLLLDCDFVMNSDKGTSEQYATNRARCEFFNLNQPNLILLLISLGSATTGTAIALTFPFFKEKNSPIKKPRRNGV